MFSSKISNDRCSEMISTPSPSSWARLVLEVFSGRVFPPFTIHQTIIYTKLHMWIVRRYGSKVCLWWIDEQNSLHSKIKEKKIGTTPNVRRNQAGSGGEDSHTTQWFLNVPHSFTGLVHQKQIVQDCRRDFVCIGIAIILALDSFPSSWPRGRSMIILNE